MATCAAFFKRPEWLASADDLCEQAAWWLGPDTLKLQPGSQQHTSRVFPDAGMVVMVAGDRHILVDAGPFGPWGSGHSHADTLSLVARAGDRDILIDPGTFTYVGDAQWRNWFRGTLAHNTVRVDQADQATAVNPFRWAEQPSCRIIAFESTLQYDHLEAECSYRGVTHHRSIRFVKPDKVHVVDRIEGPPGRRIVEQLWHPGSPEAERCLELDGRVVRLDGWKSTAFGEKSDSATLCVRREHDLPVRLEATIHLE